MTNAKLQALRGFWPDLPADLHEVLRVLRPGGTFVLIAEVYKGANTTAAKLLEKYPELIGITLIPPEEHRGLLSNPGYSNVQVIEESANGGFVEQAENRSATMPEMPKGFP